MNEKQKVKQRNKNREYRGFVRLNAEEKHILFEYFGGMAGLRDYAVNLVKENREKYGNEWQPTVQN